MTDWRVEHFGSVGSTNDLARERVMACFARGERAEGLVIVAERQTGGRGQHGRRWESPPGGAYLSVVVEDVPVEMRGKLALVAGAAVGDEIVRGERNDGLWLRWPNDLMVGEKKVGGILCEGVSQGERWAGIIGIGINVEMRLDVFPEELCARVTTLAGSGIVYREGPWTVEGVLTMLRLGLRFAFAQVQSPDGFALLIDRARQMDGLRDRHVVVETNQGKIAGIAAGIGDAGELLVRAGEKVMAIEVGTIVSVDGVKARG